MTTHLPAPALLELVESGGSHPHVDSCERCRRALDDARHALSSARDAEVPEPSPLFWDHLSARIQEAVVAEGRAGRDATAVKGWRAWPRAWRVATCATVACAFVAAGIWRIESVRRPVDVPVASAPRLGADHAFAVAEPPDAAAEASWSLVTDSASAVDLETATDAGGFALSPGAAERAALQLTPEEQRELVRLLQAAVDDEEP